MNTLSMSKKRWAIILQAAGVLAALAVVIGVAIVAGSAAPRAAHQQSHAVATATPRPQHHAAFSLPVGVNLTAVLAILGCLLALAGWAAWQRRNRCRDCGYAPVFCQCELAGSKH